ncbi:MAG: S41 family peptidase, partial [Nannocystaceae bacterium]
WSRAVDKVTSDALFMEGMRLGIGIKYRSDDDDNLVLKLVHPDSPAGVAGLRRGDVIVSVNGVGSPDVTSSDWGPNDEGLVVDFEVIPREQVGDPNAEVQLVPVTRGWYQIVTVDNAEVLDLDGESVGYFYFDTFVKTSVAELDAAFETFEAAGVTKLVVDLRYNGGGLISTARHLSNLLGSSDYDDDVMYKVQYNANLSEGDNTYRFASTTHALPLERIAFITSSSTSSASELVINALLPYTEVELIGTATAGKPVGSNSFEFCEKLLYPITFHLLNALDEGEYFDGLSPGCGGEDQPAFELGDPNESLLANALDFLRTGSCSAYQATPALLPGVDENAQDPLHSIHPAR